MGSKNWFSTAIGLFYTDEGYRIEESFDLSGWTWVKQAACQGTEPEAWFEGSHADTDLLAFLCGRCPVQVQCLDYALTHRETGWWGGLSEKERKLMLADEPTEKEINDED